MPELTLAANRIKAAASLAAKQYMGVSDTLKGALSTDQIMQRKADGQTRDRFELFETAFRIQDAFQDHVKRVYCGPEGEHKRAPIKKWTRVYQKTNRAYGGQVARCKDIVRSTLVFPDVASLLACLLRIEEDSANMVVLNIKNRMDPKYSDASGYRDVSLLLVGCALTDNLIVELQLNTASMMAAKTGGGHARYVEARDSRGD